MSKRKKRKERARAPVGASPGSLVYRGSRTAGEPVLRIISYNQSELIERESATIAQARDLLADESKVTWIEVAGLHNVAILEEIGQLFDIHPLVLEDILNQHQGPKFEVHKGHIFLIMRTLIQREDSTDDQINVIFGKNFVLSFHETEADIFLPVRNRIREERPRIRSNGSDYLTYALVDTIVDGYFVQLENMSDHIDELGDALLDGSASLDLHDIFRLKRTLGSIRHSVWPMREVVNRLTREETEFIQASTGPYLRDVYDHVIRAMEIVESLRDLTTGLHDLYLSVVSHKMNEVMKVLTIIATIFIPLTFIAGVYGMNFQFMPELHWAWGYAGVWGVMILTAGIMLLFFKRKKWF